LRIDEQQVLGQVAERRQSWPFGVHRKHHGRAARTSPMALSTAAKPCAVSTLAGRCIVITKYWPAWRPRSERRRLQASHVPQQGVDHRVADEEDALLADAGAAAGFDWPPRWW
jgi:hypothetical protein